jgi:uncharacterized SAM-binding protein YcdF (DUF218 family)
MDGQWTNRKEKTRKLCAPQLRADSALQKEMGAITFAGMASIHFRHRFFQALSRHILRGGAVALACAGGLAFLLLALPFTQIPWKAYSALARDGGADATSGSGWEPTHILVLGGSGVPGESALMRLWYAADAAGKHPGVPVWLALPCAGGNSRNPAADAYTAELVVRGVEMDRCEVRACGNNTREQAVSLVRDLSVGGREAPRVLLVTSPEHVRRACLAVRKAAGDAGADIEVRGVAAANLSLEDCREQAGLPETTPPPDEPAAGGLPAAGAPGVFRYDYWNHADYALDSARECMALLYYRIKGWI